MNLKKSKQTSESSLIEKQELKKQTAKNLLFLAFLLISLLVISFISLRAGAYQTTTPEILRGIFKKALDPNINTVVRKIRLPRLLTALVGGAALGVTGCVLQSILHNPLASASTLGISQGASFGAAFAIIALGAGASASANAVALQVKSPLLISICAFLCSISVSVLLLALSRLRALNPQAMILAGVALSSLFTGATTILQFFATEAQLTSIVFWTFGDLGRTGFREVLIIMVVTLLAVVYFFANRLKYNALDAGIETAISLGINVKQFRLVNMIFCSVAASIIVSFTGIIQFLGLIAPHMAKRITGSNHTFLLPASALIGSILLLFGDLLARVLVPPIVLPIGAITSFFGAPLFIYLLLKRSEEEI